ncbi:amidohydrolase [Nonomuraea sp. NPDC050328]|uniref:amidohydrolase n=1 Tax=Nonomuraea sp. NPDC050328 TaxID=3364361 RepID=UPI0037A0F710
MKSAGAEGVAGLVLTGGPVYTMDRADRVGEAIAIGGGRVLRVGEVADVQPLIAPSTRVVQLRGSTVLPGINDSHLHAAWLGERWPNLLIDSLAALGSPGITGARPAAGSGNGHGHRHGAPQHAPADRGLVVPAGRPPTRAHVIMPEEPPSPDPFDPPGPVDRRLDSPFRRRAAILRAWDVLIPLGITSYTEPGLGPGEADDGCFGAGVLAEYAALAAEGRAQMRVTALLLFGELDGPSSLPGFLEGLRSFEPPADVPEWFRVNGVKIFADGIPPMRTSWTDEPYPDGTHGRPLTEGGAGALLAMIEAAREAGHQVALHATGSRATRTIVEALARPKGEDERHYLIHGDVLHPGTLERMAAAGIGLNTQPGLPPATTHLIRDALGEEAARHAWPVRDAMEAGVPLCLSSDAPVLSPDWRRGVAAAVLRTLDGAPAQRLTLAQALRAYTATPAWQDGAENWKGTLEPGKVADLCVVGADLRHLPVAELPQAPIEMTVLGGKIVYEA